MSAENWHIYPRGDLRKHDLESPDCWREPTIDGDLIVHNSLDEREKFEIGERKPN